MVSILNTRKGLDTYTQQAYCCGMPNETPAWRAEAARQGIPLPVLAERTGITRRSIYAYSRGYRKPTPEWVARVTAVLAAMDEARVA